MTERNRLPISTALAVVAALGLAGCGSSDDSSSGGEGSKYGFGETEMSNAIAGTWVGTLALDGKESTTLTLQLEHSPQAGMKPACGNRSFLHASCLDISSLQLVGKLSTADAAYKETPVTGWFNVYGVETMGGGNLRLTLPDSVEMSAETTEGAFPAGQVFGSAARLGKFTLQRP